MATIVTLPQIGISEETAVLAVWHVRPGDTVNIGDNLFSLETGKATFDVAAEISGTVLALYAGEGEEYPIKAPVCAIGAAGETAPEVGGAPASPAATPQPEAFVKEAAAPQPPANENNCQLSTVNCQLGVSPRARQLANTMGVDAKAAAPTGPEGRVIERDVRALAAKAVMGTTEPANQLSTVHCPLSIEAAVPAAQDKPLSNLRKIISKSMYQSLQSTAQLTHTASFDATEILAYRAKCKASEVMKGVTLGDMVLYAVTRTLPAFPELNAHLIDDTLRIFSDVNLACAVDTPRGLLVPVVRGANKLSLLELSGQIKTLAEGARGGGIDPALLSGGSFTVSNLGGFGIESFTPILNAPQTGILGVCTTQERVRTVGGAVTTYQAMTLSLTYDHRAVDGAPASKFLQTLCRNLEQFSLLLGQ